MQDRIFYSLSLGFIFGVFLRSFVFVDLYLVILLSIIAFILFLFWFFILKNNSGILSCVFILAFCFGVFKFHLVDQPNPEIFESKIGQKVSLTGILSDEPTIKENTQKLTVLVIQGQSLENPRAPLGETKVLVSASLDEYFKYGDEVKFSGKLSKPENFMTDTGKEFDYVNYLRKDGILYVMNYANLEIISRDNGNRIKSILFYIKDKFLEKMNLAISSPENLLMGGLILGEKSNFSEALRKSFVDTGTIHIVALSGYNVTIVAEWFMKLFKAFPVNIGIGMGISAVILFVIMSGGSSTALRAGIMAVLALIARATGRNYDVARALILAGLVMIFINPFILVHDVSFQLSFMATVAVIFLAPRIEKYFLWLPDKFGLRDIFSVTVAAYIFVMPFILYKMGNLSLVALLANVLILPFIPFTMLLGFLTGFAGIIWYVLAVPFGFVSYLFLHYELAVIGFLSRIPYASLSIPNFSLWLTILIYVYFIYRLFGRSLKKLFTEPF